MSSSTNPISKGPASLGEVKGRVLIVDDEAPIRKILSDSLLDEGYEISLASNADEGIQQLADAQPQVVLLDIWMPGERDGLDVLREGRRHAPHADFIMMSGHGTIETAVRATKLGAWDFLEKPLSIEKVLIGLQNVLSFQSERKEKMVLLNRLRKNIAILGESPGIIAVKQLVSRVAPSSACVLVTGENGTGKELIAQNIHYLSSRASRAFVDVNCAAIPEELIESELFGFEKGAFTGAERAKKGKFELAHGGTLFLDEVGDMSLKAQAKVLRVLEEKKLTRVGGETSIECDARVIAATNKNLPEEIRAGRFREDLFYRLNVVPCKVPPLRDRTEDILMLVMHFSEHFAREGGFKRKVFSEDAAKRLVEHAWPGNVREIRNFVERIYILTPGDFVDVHDLRFAGLTTGEREESFEDSTNFRAARARFEKEYLLKKISENRGNISKTAEVIGLERSYLHRKIKGYGIEIEDVIP